MLLRVEFTGRRDLNRTCPSPCVNNFDLCEEGLHYCVFMFKVGAMRGKDLGITNSCERQHAKDELSIIASAEAILCVAQHIKV